MVNLGLKNSSGKVRASNLLLGVIAFIMFSMIMYFIVTTVVKGYTTTNDGEPILVEYTKDASDPVVKPSKMIMPSVDGQYGIEYTYSGWLYVDYTDTKSRYRFNKSNNSICIDGVNETCSTDYDRDCKHIFHKGDMNALPNQCPGLWLEEYDNQLHLVVRINTFKEHDNSCIGEECYLEKYDINNIPYKKWFHFTLVVINNKLDLYINGFLKKRFVLKGLPRQNVGDLYINQFGGFKGFVSRLRYFNYSLPIWKIEQLVKRGPSKNFGPRIEKAVPPYLSFNWWTRKFGLPTTNI